VNQISIQKITNDPLIITSEHFLGSEEKVVFRPLNKNDSKAFGQFLESLSQETRSKFGPHPLDFAEAKNICENLNYSEMLRMVITNKKEEIIGYIVLSFQFRDSQLLRYEDYKISLAKGRDICIAPVVADRYQNKGIGGLMLKKTIEIAHRLRVKYIILWQGTQSSNKRAIHFYEKFGFLKNSEFERYGHKNVDMTLTLNNN